MGIGRWYPHSDNLDREMDRLGLLPLRSDAGLTREQAMELIEALRLVRSKLELVETQYVEARNRLDAAGLIPPRN